MLFTYSAELFSGEHIRYLLLLHTKNRSVSVLDLTDSNTALRETDAPFLGLTWWTTSRKVWSNTTCRNNGSIAKTPCGEQGGWMLQITIYDILNTGFYLNNIFFLPLLFSLYNPAHEWDNYMRLPSISCWVTEICQYPPECCDRRVELSSVCNSYMQKQEYWCTSNTEMPKLLPVGWWWSTLSPLTCRHTVFKLNAKSAPWFLLMTDIRSEF